jgi:hypothetical protein
MITIKELFNNLNLSQKLFDKLKLNWNFTMNLLSINHNHNHLHVHVDTPEVAEIVMKAWNLKDQETNIKELNEQKPVEKEETND